MPAPPTVLNKPGSKRVYDVAIVGPDIGGAATAALSARRGLRTLLAPLGPPVMARESEGWLLPAAHPTLPPLRQLNGAAGPLDELGIGQELQRHLASSQPGGQGAFQVLGERLRLSLPADPARRRVELRRELGEAAAQEAEAAMESIEALGKPWDPFLIEPPPWPPRGFLEKRRLRKLAPPRPSLPEGLIAEALHAVAPFAASLVGDSAPEAIAREGSALFRAPLRLWGGAAQLADLLRRKAMDAGAELLPDTNATDLRLDRKGIVFQLGGSEVRAACLVLACGADAIGALAQTGDRAERKLVEEAALPVERKVTLAHFVVRPEGLPQALEEAALYLGHEAGPLLLAVHPARRARGEPARERILTAARISDAGFADAQGFLDQVRAALEPMLPFFERHIVHQSADVSPGQPHVILRSSDDGEPIGLRPQSESHERVVFASAATYPGFGIEGQLMAARVAADAALTLSGRKTVSAT